MARLIPRIDPSDIINSGERKVAEALVSQLPNDVEVFHSFNWLRSKCDIGGAAVRTAPPIHDTINT